MHCSFFCTPHRFLFTYLFPLIPDWRSLALAHLRLAPVQAALWGHAHSTHLASMDYFLLPPAAAPNATNEGDPTVVTLEPGSAVDHKKGRRRKLATTITTPAATGPWPQTVPEFGPEGFLLSNGYDPPFPPRGARGHPMSRPRRTSTCGGGASASSRCCWAAAVASSTRSWPRAS